MTRAGARRIDEVVAERTGVTRSRARALIIAGRVRLNGNPVMKPGMSVAPDAELAVERPSPYVSRGGEKLEGALRAFAFDVRGMRALDIGASTGGFTDCLLAHGAAHVVALDVGYGQLAWPLREDPRVRVIERCNFRLLPDDAFGAEFAVITVDTSFISVCTILARARAYLADGGAILALVKPQFEAGRERLGAGGVVREPAMHRAILHEVRSGIERLGITAQQVCASPLHGPAGNAEFFFKVAVHGTPCSDTAIDEAVSAAHVQHG